MESAMRELYGKQHYLQGHHKLDNLFVIIDYNKLQGFGSTDKNFKFRTVKTKI